MSELEELREKVMRKDLQIKANQSRILELMRRLEWYMAKCRKLEAELRKHGIKADFDL